MILATVLAYISGFALGVMPVMREMYSGFFHALRIIWFGGVVSIGVMEIVMNAVDFSVGGVQAVSMTSTVFWIVLAGVPCDQ